MLTRIFWSCTTLLWERVLDLNAAAQFPALPVGAWQLSNDLSEFCGGGRFGPESLRNQQQQKNNNNMEERNGAAVFSSSISAANKGKKPWNKGRQRSAEERERFLQNLKDLGLTKSEYEQQKRRSAAYASTRQRLAPPCGKSERFPSFARA